MNGKPIKIVIPYKNLKHKIRIRKKFAKEYKIEELDGILYMERRDTTND